MTEMVTKTSVLGYVPVTLLWTFKYNIRGVFLSFVLQRNHSNATGRKWKMKNKGQCKGMKGNNMALVLIQTANMVVPTKKNMY